MQQGGFNPLSEAAGLPSFMAAAAAQSPIGLPFGGLGFNPFLMPPFGSSPFEDFMKQLGAQKPDLNLNSATNDILSAMQSSVKETVSAGSSNNKLESSRNAGDKATNKRDKEHRSEKINVQESPRTTSTKDLLKSNNDKEIKDRTRRESERDRSTSNKEKERRDSDRDHERDKIKRDSIKESSTGPNHYHHHHNSNNNNNSSSSSSSKRLNNNDSSSLSSRKEQNHSNKEKSSNNQQQQNLNNQEKFLQEFMNLSQFNPNFYLNSLGFPPPQLDSASSPTPDAATAAALSQLGGPSSLDFSLLLNMMNPLFGASMPPPPQSSSAAANSVDLLSALTAAAQTNPGLLDPNQLNKNLLMDLMQQQQQQSDEINNQASHKTSSHKKHSIDSISRSSSNNKQNTSKTSESSSSHHHHSASKQQSSNKHNQQSSSSLKINSSETFQGLDLSIKKSKK